MSLIDDIREKIAADAFEFSQHAVDQSIVRHISLDEVIESIASGEVIEDYPEDKYGPSCSFWDSPAGDARCTFNAATPPDRS